MIVLRWITVFMFALAFLSSTSASALAQVQAPQLVVETHISDARQTSPSEITSCLAFTAGSAVYLPEGYDQTPATVTFTGFTAAAHITARTGNMIGAVVSVDDVNGRAQWTGDLVPRDAGATEFVVDFGDNIYYQTTIQFHFIVEATGFATVDKAVTLINNCAPPPPPTYHLTGSTWVTDGAATYPLNLTTGLPFTTGVAVYHDIPEGHDTSATVEFSGLDASWEPVLKHGSSVSGTTSALENGKITWTGALPKDGNTAAEFWVEVKKNVFYGQEVKINLSVEAVSVTDPLTVTYTVVNPNPPPPVTYYNFCPIVAKVSAPTPPANPVVLDVSASDGVTSSRESPDGILHTTRAFAINLAIYPKVAAQLKGVVVNFTIFEPRLNSVFNQDNALGGVHNFSGMGWTWGGDLKVGVDNASVMWVSVPDDRFFGIRTFEVSVIVPGYPGPAIKGTVTVDSD